MRYRSAVGKASGAAANGRSSLQRYLHGGTLCCGVPPAPVERSGASGSDSSTSTAAAIQVSLFSCMVRPGGVANAAVSATVAGGVEALAHVERTACARNRATPPQRASARPS